VRNLFIALVALACVLGLLMILGRRLWVKNSDAKVVIAHQVTHQALAYFASGNRVLVVDTARHRVYEFSPAAARDCSPIDFLFIKRFALQKRYPLQCALMPQALPLAWSNTFVDFTLADGTPVEVSWPSQ
jgi:hypothetical protein